MKPNVNEFKYTIEERIEMFRALAEFCGFQTKITTDEKNTKIDNVNNLVQKFNTKILGVDKHISIQAMTGSPGKLYSLFLNQNNNEFLKKCCELLELKWSKNENFNN